MRGLVVGIPAARKAAETAAMVRRAGGVPVVGPAMAEVSVERDHELRAVTEQVCRGVDIAIHLTGVGTSRWFEAARTWGMDDALRNALVRSEVVARGVKAAAALRRNGVCESWRPVSETSAEIAERLSVPSGARVVIQRHGGEPPSDLPDALHAVTYRWSLPDDTAPVERLVRQIALGAVDVLLITAGPQVDGLCQVAEELGVSLAEALETMTVGAVGPMAAARLAEAGLPCHVMPDPPRLGALLRAVTEASQPRDTALRA